MRKAILFDLDGTLTDSSIGITRCVNKALKYYGLEKENLDELRVFIGPPLRDTFPKFGVPKDEVEHAVELYRERYLTKGKYENEPYKGIEELLTKLKKHYDLYIATSKPEETAIDIIQHFHLDHYFNMIAGATMSGDRDSKEDVLNYLLQHINTKDYVMIGDTKFDVIGAKKCGIDTIAVSWGFGLEEELKDAVKLSSTPEELYQDIIHYFGDNYE